MKNLNIENYKNINISNEDLAKMISDKTETDFVPLYISALAYRNVENIKDKILTEDKLFVLVSKEDFEKFNTNLKNNNCILNDIEIDICNNYVCCFVDPANLFTSKKSPISIILENYFKENMILFSTNEILVNLHHLKDINWAIPYILKNVKITIDKSEKNINDLILTAFSDKEMIDEYKDNQINSLNYAFNCIDENIEKIMEEQIEGNIQR